MTDLSKIRIFRMTHINNVPHMLNNGITHAKSPNRNPDYTPIGDNSLISCRSSKKNPINGKIIGDCIPFYFGPRMPMLYIIQNGFNNVPQTTAEDIIYCVSNVQQILDHNLAFMFTDGHAINELSSFFDQTSIYDVKKHVDFSAVSEKLWGNGHSSDLDLKRRKEAEFLIESDIPPSAIAGWVTYNDNAKQRMIDMGISAGIIAIKSNYYF